MNSFAWITTITIYIAITLHCRRIRLRAPQDSLPTALSGIAYVFTSFIVMAEAITLEASSSGPIPVLFVSLGAAGAMLLGLDALVPGGVTTYRPTRPARNTDTR